MICIAIADEAYGAICSMMPEDAPLWPLQGQGGLTMHVNKVSHVRTIDRVATELGEDVDWLFDVALEMELEDGVIWVQGPDDESVMAFTDFGVDGSTRATISGDSRDDSRSDGRMGDSRRDARRDDSRRHRRPRTRAARQRHSRP